MKKLIIFLLLLTYSTAFSAITVTVTVHPQRWLVKEIGGDRVNVNVITPKGVDPHIFNPKINSIKTLADSKLYFKIGYPFENTLLPNFTKNYKDIVFIDTTKGINALEHSHEHADHEHADHEHADHEHADHEHADHEHADHEIDPHFWTSPKNMLIMAKNILNALIEVDIENKEFYVKNYENLEKQINDVDKKFTTLFESPKINKTFLIYHPALGYFAKDYGLVQLEIEKDGKTPKINELKEVIDQAKKDKVNVFIVQAQDNKSAINTVSTELKIKAQQIDLLTDNWTEMMENIYNSFAGKK